ncbi:hypothetical protein WBP07_21755 (plasmid) [Novosphingobium sp. BL-8A]
MAPHPRSVALSDSDLLTLGRHYFQSADRQDASHADLVTLRDFLPAVLHRLQAKLEGTDDLVESEMTDLQQPDLFGPTTNANVEISESRG